MDKARTKRERRLNVNNSNLIPNTERSPEELREMGRKGGIASGKARRRKRDLQKLARMLLDKQVVESFKEMVGMKDDE
jgi:3-methyladenine DNA glycosylase/8-oxoguanine DNA glycosylase